MKDRMWHNILEFIYCSMASSFGTLRVLIQPKIRTVELRRNIYPHPKVPLLQLNERLLFTSYLDFSLPLA